MEKTRAKCGNTDEADMRFCTKCGEPYEMPDEEDDYDVQSTRVNIDLRSAFNGDQLQRNLGVILWQEEVTSNSMNV